MNKKTVYIDMDGVIVNFQTGIDRLSAEVRAQFPNDKNIDEAEGIFGLMDPFEGAVEAVVKLANSDKLDVFILSTAPWRNPSAWSDKLAWIQDHFGEDEDSPLYKRVILSHRKDLNQGDFLIDDRKKNGAEDFGGLHIHFGEANEKEQRDGSFPDWDSVLKYFRDQDLLDDRWDDILEWVDVSEDSDGFQIEDDVEKHYWRGYNLGYRGKTLDDYVNRHLSGSGEEK
jgi:5'-nucleotidase